MIQNWSRLMPRRLLVAAFCCLAMVGGCEKPSRAKLRSRLEESRANFSDRLADGAPCPMERSYANTYKALHRATPETLVDPVISDARFWRSWDKKQALLSVHWIQDYPTADAIRVLWSDGTQKDFSISKENQLENRKDSLEFVAYGAQFGFPHGSADEKEWETESAPSVVLLRSGECISQPVSVHWVFHGDEGKWGTGVMVQLASRKSGKGEVMN